MPQTNNTLNRAKDAKNDEFYTFKEDIENEISKYDLSQFENKIVYCNCDDPTWSNFFKFFTRWGQRLNIKEVHFTNFANGKREFKQLTLFESDDLVETIEDDKKGTAHHWIYTPATGKIIKKQLKGNGDFRSDECLSILNKSDIVVTNPPFSLFREFINLVVVQNKKQLLIIGDINNVSYIETFTLIKNNELWFGNTAVKKFLTGELQTKTFGNKCWFTNLKVNYRNQPLVLHNQDLTQYKKYDNYDAIEVSQVKLIPDNYYDPMGVPTSFLQKYNPKQFEILGQTGVDIKLSKSRPYLNGKRLYARLIIRRKSNELPN